jgi:cytochrome P450
MMTMTTGSITRDDETWWVRSPALAADLIHDKRVTARRALEPWTPPVGDAATMWQAFKDSPAGAQAASSLLATDGARHAYLADPVIHILNSIPDDPAFIARTAALAAEAADDLSASSSSWETTELDIAAVAYRLPAQSVVEMFGLGLTAAEVDSCSEQQTGFLWRREISEAEQVAALRAAWQLRQACEAAADDPPPGSVAARLAAVLPDRADVVGLLYGVSIPWIMGVKYGITNAVIETTGTDEWDDLSEAALSTRGGRLVAGRITGAALRRRPPVKSIFRSAAEEIDVGGETIEAGDRVGFDVAALNAADEEEWTFGVPEHHFCVGARIARRQVAAQVAAIAYALPGATLDESHLTMIDSRFHNGPRRLRIAP